MTIKPQSKVSAQVILAPASGRRDAGAAITAQNIDQFRPSEDAVSAVQAGFARAKFEVGTLAGNSFSITGTVKQFDDVFKTKLRKDTRGALTARSRPNTYTLELPLDALPEDLRKHLVAVTFTAPPAFGPTGY
jgi:hypothetical protein